MGPAPLHLPMYHLHSFNLLFSRVYSFSYFCFSTHETWGGRVWFFFFFDDRLRRTFADGKVENFGSLSLPPAVFMI